MRVCAHHPTQAKWHCDFCDEALCEDCVESRSYKGDEIRVCKDCGGRVISLSSPRDATAAHGYEENASTGTRQDELPEPPDPAREPLTDDSPWRLLGLPYLWSGDGPLLLPMLAVAALALAIAPEFIAWLPIAGWFLAVANIMVMAWILGIGIGIIRTSLAGQKHLTFEDNLVSGDGLWLRQGTWVAMIIIGFGPMAVYHTYVAEDSVDLTIYLALVLWKDLYLTLALPSYTWFGNWASILPAACLRDVTRVGTPFLGLLTACFGLSLLTEALSALLSLLSGPVVAQTQLLLLMFLGFLLKTRWIGVFYRKHLPTLGW